MTRHGTKISKRFLFVYFMLGGLIFLFTPARVTGKLQLVYARLFRWPLAAGRGVTVASRTTLPADAGDPANYTELQAKYRQIENIAANLRAHLGVAQQQIAELQKVRNEPDWNRMPLIRASVLSDPGQGQNGLFINRGRADGLAVGQFVLGNCSVIGTISGILDQTARVKLITDPTSRVPVRVAQLKALGIMEGRGPNAAGIRQVPSRQRAQKGDRVYALKTPGFPEIPFVTAVVVECKPDEDPLLWDITVRPVCDITNLKSVHVVVPSR